MHKDIPVLGPNPQRDAIRPPKSRLDDVLPARAGARDVQRGELLEEVAVLARRVRAVERRVRQAREQPGQRAARRVPAAVHARDVPVGERALQLGRPARVRGRGPAVCDGPADGVDIHPTGHRAIATQGLEGHLVFGQAELVGWY